MLSNINRLPYESVAEKALNQARELDPDQSDATVQALIGVGFGLLEIARVLRGDLLKIRSSLEDVADAIDVGANAMI